MGWNTIGDSSRTRPLTVHLVNNHGSELHRAVSFPGGTDKALVGILEVLLRRAQEMGYDLHPGWCWGYFVKDIAGTTMPSFHGKGGGRAIDINAPTNGRGTRGDIPMKVVEMFERNGFVWGGRWSYTDPMHFEAHNRPGWYRRRLRKLRREERRAKAKR